MPKYQGCTVNKKILVLNMRVQLHEYLPNSDQHLVDASLAAITELILCGYVSVKLRRLGSTVYPLFLLEKQLKIS